MKILKKNKNYVENKPKDLKKQWQGAIKKRENLKKKN